MNTPVRTGASMQSLERRQMLANYGSPWPDGSRLTLSFAPDTTSLVEMPSTLFASLDAVLTRAEWQRQIATALQAWAVHTDVNVGFLPDSAERFGATGFTLGDPRFGDIRIGAHEMTPEVLAVSVPYDPARAGTLTGDIFLNSAYDFDGSPYDLMTVMLHEAGHVFGLDHSTDPESPMFARFNNPVSSLTPGDVVAIRALYGDRMPDRFDLASANGTIGDASQIPAPNGYDGTTPLAAFGDLTTTDDVDFFRFQAPSDDNGYNGTVTLQLRTSGISLMRPEITVYDAGGTRITSAVSTAFLGDTLSLTFNAASDDTDFFIGIDSPATDEFAVGRYALAAVFNARNSVDQATIDQVLLGPHETLDAQTLRELFLSTNSVYLNRDAGNNDLPATPTTMQPVRSGSYEVIGSIEAVGDVDHYRFISPDSFSSVLTLNLWSVDPRGLIPRMTITGGAIGREIANGNRTVTLQIEGVGASTEISLRVEGSRTGNYFLNIDRATPLSILQTFASGSTKVSGETRVDTLYVAQAQLMHLLLSADPHSDPNATLHLQIVNESNRVVYTLSAGQGRSVSGPSVLLTPGAYRVRYVTSSSTQRITTASTALSSPLAASDALFRDSLHSRLLAPLVPMRFAEHPTNQVVRRPEMRFTLSGSTLSGPIGPSVRNALLRPRFVHPTLSNTYLYPPNSASGNPYLWVASVL